MRVILFQKRFAPLVASGQKTQTIRKTAWCRPGDMLSLRKWIGKPYRSKQRVLMDAKCTQIQRIVITYDAMFLDGYGCPIVLKNAIAKLDGFSSWSEMREWFDTNHGLPFDGYLITWEAK